jgi:threonine synthase
MKCICSNCAQPLAAEMLCACGGLPEFVLKTTRIDPAGFKRIVRERFGSHDSRFAGGVWRFRELLPPISDEAIVSLGEGIVPLYASDRGGAYAGLSTLAYLHLGLNPTGSFKDLGMTVAISAAKAAAARTVACASTGNTGASMAAYAARAELSAITFVPRGRIAAAKLAQIHSYGARIVEVEGSFDAAFDRLRTAKDDGVVVVNSTNPYRIEGQKCATLIMLEHRMWRVPDWVVIPGGNLGNASAFGKGFREARALGLIDRLPRLAVVQASGAAPFFRAWASHEALVPIEPQTSASAIAVGAPRSWRKALREIRASEGTVVAVDDTQIEAARACINGEGIGCELASAASLAGAKALRSLGTIEPSDDVVAVLTGHILKDLAGAHA